MRLCLHIYFSILFYYMNLINFHTYPENAKYIRENYIHYNGQGLVHCCWIMPCGNGHNTYHFTVKDEKENIMHITVEEQHVINWKIRSRPEYKDMDETDELEFEALGKIEETKEYILLNANSYNDYIGDLKVINISITNNKPVIPFLNITNEFQYCDDILTSRENNCVLATLTDWPLDNAIDMKYSDIYDKDNWTKQMYFVVDEKELLILPFKIKSLIRGERSADDIMEADVKYELDKHMWKKPWHPKKYKTDTMKIELYSNPETDEGDKCNIRIDIPELDIYDYCRIKIDK